MVIEGLYTLRKVTDKETIDMPPTTREKAIADYNTLVRYMNATKDETAIIVIVTIDTNGKENIIKRTVVPEGDKDE